MVLSGWKPAFPPFPIHVKSKTSYIKKRFLRKWKKKQLGAGLNGLKWFLHQVIFVLLSGWQGGLTHTPPVHLPESECKLRYMGQPIAMHSAEKLWTSNIFNYQLWYTSSAVDSATWEEVGWKTGSSPWLMMSSLSLGSIWLQQCILF